MTERTPLTTYRNSDLRVVYQFPQDTDLTDMVPSFFYRLEAGATPLLTVTNTPSSNGSSAVIIGTAVVVTLKIADLAVFPAVDVWSGVYDSVLTKNGFVNKFVGGPLTQYVDGSYGDELFGDTVIVSVDGTEIPIIIEGGNLGASVGVGLAALNAAVKAAEDAAIAAAAAAQEAVNAAASVPAMIAGKLDTDGDNADPELLNNLGVVPSVSVDQFGAQPGVSLFNSTASIHAAIAAVAALGGGRVLFPSAGGYYANVDLVGSNITLEWPAGATVGTHALRPFDGTKAPLTIGGSDTTITRDCALINPCISGVKIGGNYALAADNAPAALDIKGNTAILHIQNPHIYNGVVTIRAVPSATKEVVSVKVYGGEARNDIADSGGACTFFGEYVNTLGYFNDFVFFGTKFNGPQQGATVHMAGGALFEGHGCYFDMYPGATFKFTTGGTALFHGCNLDPHGIDEIIVVTDDLTTDPNRVWQGDIRHGPQKWQNGLGTVFDIPDEANNVYYRAALRNPWLNDAIYFGRSTNRYSTTESMIPRSDTGPMDLFGMDWSVRNTTQATDLDTAALQTKGGLSVTKDARIGGAIEVYGGNAFSGGQITASSAAGGLFIASNIAGEDVQIVPGGGAYLRVRGGFGIRTHDDNVQANGITGNAWAYTTSYAYRDGSGVKLLGSQASAVADATDAASVIIQLNALLSRLRAHGLIAT